MDNQSGIGMAIPDSPNRMKNANAGRQLQDSTDNLDRVSDTLNHSIGYFRLP
ncbi:hypothetical protein [Paludibacterium paludis]|uniref:Uncharacterized protein n=1 Tax=Paludibacterium paludis TaxID=1225769 RepID=A0A918P1Y7_9NEIS|nr:hypothetical protein [Paludibacterium paludis]GGY13310.1 hypothetical protein GCM10011289_15750 [Paludibacterium paludis]